MSLFHPTVFVKWSVFVWLFCSSWSVVGSHFSSLHLPMMLHLTLMTFNYAGISCIVYSALYFSKNEIHHFHADFGRKIRFLLGLPRNCSCSEKLIFRSDMKRQFGLKKRPTKGQKVFLKVKRRRVESKIIESNNLDFFCSVKLHWLLTILDSYLFDLGSVRNSTSKIICNSQSQRIDMHQNA